MDNQNLYEDTVNQLAQEADAIGLLAQDSGGFAAVFAAFESKDPIAFRWVLERLDMLSRCELICEWVRTKWCVLRCIQVCGPVRENADVPDLLEFARAIVQLASNEKVLRQVVDAVSCGNAEEFHGAIGKLKLQRFCHLLCHYVCSIIYHRVCEVVCTPQPVIFSDPGLEIQAEARAIAEMLAKKKAFDTISKAAIAFDCGLLRTSMDQTGLISHCEIFCRLFCTWRCVWICTVLCPVRTPILTGAHAIEEAREFALVSRQLASHPRALHDLVAAVERRDAKAYAEIISRFGLGPFCYQVCGWVCSRVCHWFCYCVCPNPALQPWFTRVGNFDIYADINTASGKANKSVIGVGGDKFAFFGCLELRGFCPINSPAFPGVQMKYRFLYDSGSGPLPITNNLVCPVEAGSRIINWPQNVGGAAGAALVPTFQTVKIQASPVPLDPIPPATGAPWVGPDAHYIAPDPVTGWIFVDANAVGGGFQTLLGFDTNPVVPGGDPIAGPPPVPIVTAGSVVPAGSQRAGKDLSITFEATRVTTFPPGTTADYSNALAKIHINNWDEVNELNFAEFVTGCCTPIDRTLSVQFTVDHEEMDAGTWVLEISSCSLSAPGNVTAAARSAPGAVVTGRGGSGTLVENTSGWQNCSYTVKLTTTPGLTTGLLNKPANPNPLTFAICGH